MDLTASIAAKSDQQNYDDFTGPRTVTITEVQELGGDQPFAFHLAEYPGRPYKPSKSMRRVMVKAWGPDPSPYTGRRLTLYGDPLVKFGGQVVGGIKISHLSHIDGPMKVLLADSKSKRSLHTVQPLADTPPPKPEPTVQDRIDSAVALFEKRGTTLADLEAAMGSTRAEWDAAELDALRTLYKDGANA